jgi:hypothetical protein
VRILHTLVFDRQTGGGLAIVVPGSKRSTKRVHAVRRTNMKPDYHSMATEGRARMVLKVLRDHVEYEHPPAMGRSLFGQRQGFGRMLGYGANKVSLVSVPSVTARFVSAD